MTYSAETHSVILVNKSDAEKIKELFIDSGISFSFNTADPIHDIIRIVEIQDEEESYNSSDDYYQSSC